MQANRRTFFGFLGAAPIAIKQAGDKAIANLAAVNEAPYGGATPCSPAPDGITSATRQKIISQFRPDFESLIYERERRVGVIDADIAVHKSFSLNAKITFQRQRNVAREMKEEETGLSSWGSVGRFFFDKMQWLP